MSPARPLYTLSMAGLAVALALVVAGILAAPGLQWFAAHGAVATTLFVLPVLAGLHVDTLHRLGGQALAAGPLRVGMALLVAGGFLLGLGHLFQPSGLFAILAFVGVLMVAVGMGRIGLLVLRAVPRQSVRTDDPLTKGDDASWKHVKFAHFFLLAGLVMLVITYAPGVAAVSWLSGLRPAAFHLLLVGYGLLSLYGIGHLWVPRFSGVPAIAAGAIKGELHTTLLGLTGITIGFLTGITGFLVGLGPFVFLGFFTYMGVLGANIMKRKSRTARVTPEFVYIPWTFAGIFWLISGVLMGIFLNAIPDPQGEAASALRWLAEATPALRWVHIHTALFGGLGLLWLGWLTRILSTGQSPPAFAGALKGSFYAWNAALAVAGYGQFLGSQAGPWTLAGAFLAALSLLLYVSAMRGFLTGSPPGADS